MKPSIKLRCEVGEVDYLEVTKAVDDGQDQVKLRMFETSNTWSEWNCSWEEQTEVQEVLAEPDDAIEFAVQIIRLAISVKIDKERRMPA